MGAHHDTPKIAHLNLRFPGTFTLSKWKLVPTNQIYVRIVACPKTVKKSRLPLPPLSHWKNMFFQKGSGSEPTVELFYMEDSGRFPVRIQTPKVVGLMVSIGQSIPPPKIIGLDHSEISDIQMGPLGLSKCDWRNSWPTNIDCPWENRLLKTLWIWGGSNCWWFRNPANHLGCFWNPVNNNGLPDANYCTNLNWFQSSPDFFTINSS